MDYFAPIPGENKEMNKTTLGMILVLAIVAVSSLALAGMFTASRTVTNTGNLKTAGVAVYWNKNGTNETRSIDWGTLNPNSTKSFTFYVKNNGTAPVVLSMSTGNWNPSNAQGYLPLNWNCTGWSLNATDTVGATLTMSVLPDITGITNFSFEITLTGTGSY